MKIRITKKGLPKAQFGYPNTWQVSMPPTYDESTGMINTTNPVVTQQDTRNLGFSDSGVYIKDAANNLQNTLQTGSAKDIKQGIANFNKDYGTKLKDPRMFKFGNNALNTFDKLDHFGDSMQKGIAVASAITSFFDDNRKQKEADEYLRNQKISANLFPTVTNKDRGDYVATGTSLGMFRPDQMVVNKGMYTGQFYPTAQLGGFTSVIPDMLSSSYTSLAGSLPAMNYVPSGSSKSTATASANLPAGYEGRLSHNNPGNIHIGDFAKKYGAIAGRPDAGGKVAVFPDMGTGIKAMQDLLFGNAYSNLTAKDARRKWVGFPSDSEAVMQKMFGNKKLSEFSADEKAALMNEFIKYEDRDVYNYLKSNNMIFQLGGESNTEVPMKIRITAVPSMEYGGQNGYGLDLGQKKVYTDMTDNPYDSPSKTMSEENDPDSPYVLEAEGGETVVRPDGTHFNISGPSHAQGGVKLTEQQVPANSFIFSKTKKMAIKDPEILKYFGKSYKSGGIVPADIAKQYDLNKVKAVLDDPNSDDIEMKTASLLKKNYEKKLGTLALVQEGMKGFPSGIPQIADSIMPQAAFGGYLEKYQTKGEVTPPQKGGEKMNDLGRVDKARYAAAKASGEWNEIRPGVLQRRVKIKDETPGTPGSTTQVQTPGTIRAIPGGTPGKSWEDFIKGELKRGVTIDELVRMKHGTREGLRKYEPYYVPAQGKTITTDPTPGTPAEYELQQMSYDENPGPKVPPITIPPQKGVKSFRPFFGSQFFVTPSRYSAYAAPMSVVTPEPTFYDPNRLLAANAEQMNIMTGALSTLGSPQSFMSNASAVQGKGFENAANTMSDVQNKNVGVANTFSPMRASIMNNAAAYDADRVDKIDYNNKMFDRDYKAESAKYLRNFDAYRGNEYKNRTYENLMNQVNPYFQYVNTPRGGMMVQRPGVDASSIITGMAPGLQGQSSGTLSPQQYLELVQNYQNTYPKADAQSIREAIYMQYPGMRGSTRTPQQRALANMFGMAASMAGRYPQEGFDISDLYDR